MLRSLPFFIGLRYTRARRRNHFISFITLTSMLGITLGVWALITVLSVMNGFERELRNRILGVASHVTISGGDGWLSDWSATDGALGGVPEIEASAPFVLGQGMLTKGREVHGALIRGILPEREGAVSPMLSGSIVDGGLENLSAGGYGIVLGGTLAYQLGVYVGSKVTVVAPRGQITPAGLLPRLKRFTVVGIFRVNMHEYDSALALIHLEDAMTLYKSGARVSGLRLKLEDVFQAPLIRRALSNTLGPAFSIRDWTLEHANFFRALKIEKRVMFIILFLIVAVAAFNIVSTLVMVVTDKQADIAILRTLGMSPASVMGVFMVQGTVIGIIGTILGALTGVVTSLNIETLVPFVENLFNIEFFPADVYVITDFPAELHWNDVFRITVASLIMSVVATVYPARRASRTHPAEALRYE
jgi:lipoprotein-releasing system permease protein